MFFAKCLLLLFVLTEIESGLLANSRSCPTLRLQHGRARTRQRSKMVKFTCYPGYDLVGNKYATCKNGVWDEPVPVCVRTGCKPIQKPDNAIQWNLHEGAWVVTFCLPGYSLQDSSVIYCDGIRWNATAPVCVADSKTLSNLSCDFENPDICGWTQDDLHDFDWKRQNRHTPSHFLHTGPDYDHTFGIGGNGYYMYIESTSKLENDTARLLSPIFNSSLAKEGCFSFFYHMYGKTTGGLRIYQKPDNIALQALLQLPAVDQKRYLLFEKWGDQGDTWFNEVASLNDFNDNFQIVVEGIRGSSFTSDIAIDDVAILQGENCTAARKAAVTPSDAELESCAGRCNVFGRRTPSLPPGGGCRCLVDCLLEEDCCPDFFEECVFGDTTPETMPETQKLVASTLSTVAATPLTSTTSGIRRNSKMPITNGTSTIKETPVIPKLSTAKITPSKLSPVNITTAASASTKTSPVSTTSRTTAAMKSTTTQPPTATKSTASSKIPKVVFKSTTVIYNATGRIKKDNSTKRPVFPTTTKRSRVENITTSTSTRVATATTKRVAATTARPTERTTIKFVRKSVIEENVESRGIRTGAIVITSLVLLAGLAWLVFWLRGATGKVSIARLRGRTTGHPEVRFLTANAVDDAE